MKILKNLILLLTVFAFVLTASCKKYPDGPLLSLYTRQHRVVGYWDVEYFSINGNDSTSYLKSNSLYGKYDFGKSQNGRADFLYYNNAHTYSAEGYWAFDNDDQYIKIDITHASQHLNIGPFGSESCRWTIQRLKEKELWLKINYTDGKEYFVKFRKTTR